MAVDDDKLIVELRALTQKWRRDAGACAEHADYIGRQHARRHADSKYFQGEAHGLTRAIRDVEKMLEES